MGGIASLLMEGSDGIKKHLNSIKIINLRPRVIKNLRLNKGGDIEPLRVSFGQEPPEAYEVYLKISKEG